MVPSSCPSTTADYERIAAMLDNVNADRTADAEVRLVSIDDLQLAGPPAKVCDWIDQGRTKAVRNNRGHLTDFLVCTGAFDGLSADEAVAKIAGISHDEEYALAAEYTALLAQAKAAAEPTIAAVYDAITDLPAYALQTSTGATIAFSVQFEGKFYLVPEKLRQRPQRVEDLEQAAAE
jgi:hypothetical protein